MAKHRKEAAETIWVLAELLEPRVSRRRDSIKLSIPAGTKEQVYDLRAISKFPKIVKKATFGDTRGWLLGLWYVIFPRKPLSFIFVGIYRGCPSN